MVESFIEGLLVGAVVGTSLGPVAFWGAAVLKDGATQALPIIIGGSLGDLFLVSSVLFVRRADDGMLSQAIGNFARSLAGSPVEVAVLVMIGAVLLTMDSNGTPTVRTKTWGRYLFSFLGTLRPDTFAAAWFAMEAFARADADTGAFLAGVYIGAFATWCLSVGVFIHYARAAVRALAQWLMSRGRVFGGVGSLIASSPPLTKCLGVLCIAAGMLSSAPLR
ncbi:MAG: hypothetical protein KGI78_01895 [Patescibacteria group bacterium]|nr:hypothetical protein [Patescibacteria group bacterium]MDE1944079.1 hypothetical protein [Patescibacteria group bacterium]MDE1945472.1 hypothetical protein [Patescibacteria group bacterium]MDE2057587.1 hypothetical protein [Patescibacteria group bacterium]